MICKNVHAPGIKYSQTLLDISKLYPNSQTAECYLRVMTGIFQNGCHENVILVIQFQ